MQRERERERERERAEKIQCEIYTIRNLVNLLCDHFECKRCNNQIEDWYSLQHNFEEYRELAYTILHKLIDNEKEIKELIKDLYK